MRLRPLLLPLLAALALPAAARAQERGRGDDVVPEQRRVSGRVLRPGGDSLVGASDAWVTIHRVGPDTAGPLDSVRTDRDGRYEFRYRTSGSERAVYFVSASFAGIAYFSQPLTAPSVSGEDAEIVVFDTTSARVPVSVRGRHVIVLAPTAGGERREVVEVYELSNDTTVTGVAGQGAGAAGKPTWSAVVPSEAREFRVGQGDVAPDAVRLASGRVELYAPLAPGLKQLSFSYTLPSGAFPLRVPMERPTSVLEVLVEGAQGAASGAQLKEVNPVVQGGRNFRRFLAQDAPASAVASIEFPAIAVAGARSLYVALVVALAGALMLFALYRAASRGRRPAIAGRGALGALAPPPLPPDADRLAREIATLDAAFERRGAPGDDARAAYRARRAALKRELTDALAAREGRA